MLGVCVCVGVLSVGLGPGLDSMSPARSRRSASHAAGTHGRLPQKTGRPGLRRGGVGGYNLHSVPPNSPPDCGTPTTSRLYPFGAISMDHHHLVARSSPLYKWCVFLIILSRQSCLISSLSDVFFLSLLSPTLTIFLHPYHSSLALFLPPLLFLSPTSPLSLSLPPLSLTCCQ